MRSTLITAAGVSAALALAGCGGGGHSTSATTATGATAATSAAQPAPSGAGAVSIANYAYAPAALHVKVGTTVRFTNHDTTAHTATATGGLSFDTGTLKPGASGTVTLTKPGTYSYICQFHAFMKGTITVTG